MQKSKLDQSDKLTGECALNTFNGLLFDNTNLSASTPRYTDQLLDLWAWSRSLAPKSHFNIPVGTEKKHSNMWNDDLAENYMYTQLSCLTLQLFEVFHGADLNQLRRNEVGMQIISPQCPTAWNIVWKCSFSVSDNNICFHSDQHSALRVYRTDAQILPSIINPLQFI